MNSVQYNKERFYFDEDLNLVYDFKKDKLSVNKVKQLGFDNTQELINCFSKLAKKNENSKNLFFDQKSFRQLLAENLSYKNFNISYDATKELVKGINIQTIKRKDISNLIKQIDNIRKKNVLEYKLIPLDYEKKISKKDFEKSKHWMLEAPYGRIESNRINLAPVLVEHFYS